MIGALILIDTVAWVAGCWWLERAVASGLAATEGWAVDTGRIGWDGWPVAVELVAGPISAAASGPGAFPPGLQWQVEHVRLRWQPWRPTQLALRAFGRQSVGAAGLAPLAFEAAASQLDIDLTGSAPPELLARGLDVATPAGTVRIADARARLWPDRVLATVHGLGVPGVAPAADELELDATVEPVPVPAASARDSAADWQAAGGTVRLDRSVLRWGPLQASLTGSGGLDAGLQPEASGTLVASGLPALLDLLAASGTLPPGQAVAARAVLAVLAAPAPGTPLALPVSLGGGVLTVARYPLLRLPPLRFSP